MADTHTQLTILADALTNVIDLAGSIAMTDMPADEQEGRLLARCG